MQKRVGRTSARARYDQALVGEFERRGIDISAFVSKNPYAISFARKVCLEDRKLVLNKSRSGGRESAARLFDSSNIPYRLEVHTFASSSRGEKIEVEDVSIERIGHLRSAICGNVVGVIAKLQECFPGYVVMEALNSKLTNSHFLQNHAYLANMINEKLYSRFQIKNEVPPILKKFRSDIGGKEPIQHGKVIYVNQDGTSNQCPVCGWKLFGHLVSEDWERSMRHWSPQENVCAPEAKLHDFRKSKAVNWCEYRMDTNPGEFDYIKTGDELATYNIAKRAFNYLCELKT